MSLQGCASRCSRNPDINCKAFGYKSSQRLCHLYERRPGHSRVNSTDWSLYEDRDQPHVHLMGGEGDNEGWVEIMMEDDEGRTKFGGICDNGGVGSNEADVICREAGFPLGALRILREFDRPFGRGHGQVESVTMQSFKRIDMAGF